ncbi:transcriptional regulator [Saccharomonospora sp. CUA-673]|uniref:helix-turn-helix transcriptional regulator n=1 Tax=Saccharomonospora sp. CUA-673 TaxID=1904969 RepID=UPI000966B67D|nr:helix-turn-helix transcriptional regulator [Saccharomonospora sp. CUA-673]OLT45434.1 transcriptional regulator [Saccharomonospora sp. CUA-673]
MPEQLEPRLADFLRAARARITPAAAGIAEDGRRRVDGLRREELAMLAGVSVDYYTRLEQGRSKSASVQVLDAIGEALQLDDAERTHLHAIARQAPTRRRRNVKPQQLHPATRALLDTLDDAAQPAFVLGRCLDVLAQNRLAALLIADFDAMPAAERNQARFVFLDPHARELYAEWEQVAADTVAMLRMDAGARPDDPGLGRLVGDLSINSPEFGRLWARHRVHRRSTGTKRYHHPLVGDLTVTYQALTPGDDPDQTLIIYSTDPGSPSAHALELLVAHAQEADVEQRRPDVTARSESGRPQAE